MCYEPLYHGYEMIIANLVLIIIPLLLIYHLISNVIYGITIVRLTLNPEGSNYFPLCKR